MAVSCCFFLFFSISISILTTHSEYHLSESKLTRDHAEEYCQQHCQSNLASIHSQNDLDAIRLLMRNQSDTLWIGLNKASSANSFAWTDSSPFDYGSSLIIDTNSNSNNVYQFHYDETTKNYHFISSEATNAQMFVCNECQWKVVSKYNYASNEIGTFQNAEQKCNDLYGTNLASVHTNNDVAEIAFLSALILSNSGIFIGLNDKKTEQVYEWTDKSTVDYLPSTLNLNASESRDCVIVTDAKWTTTNCNNAHGMVCNARNALCNSSDWLSDTPNEWEWHSSNCSVYHNNNNLDNNSSLTHVLSSKWTQIAIDYRFQLNASSSSENRQYCGINIEFHSDSRDEISVFYAGLHYKPKTNEIFLFLMHRFGQTWQSQNLFNDINLSKFYNLRIEIDENAMLSIGLNDDFTLLNAVYIGDLLPDKLSFIHSIGIENDGVSAQSEYLFYNGQFTQYPTISPTTSPTAEICPMEDAVFAQWSPSHLSIFIHFVDRFNAKKQRKMDGVIEEYGVQYDVSFTVSEDITCRSIFDKATLALLGSAKCTFVQTKNAAAAQGLDQDVAYVIHLESDSTISISDEIKFKKNAQYTFYCKVDKSYSDIVISAIRPSLNPLSPQIALSSSTSRTIGICDNLILDARSSTNLGGRDGTFEWNVLNLDTGKIGQYEGANQKISHSKLDAGLHSVNVTSTTWYGASSSYEFEAYVSPKPIPIVSLSGANIYRKSNKVKGKVDISADIRLNQKCLNKKQRLKNAYTISWSVTVQKLMDDSTVINNRLLNKLQKYLLSKRCHDKPHISISDKYLQPGLEYTFSMLLDCDGDCYDAEYFDEYFYDFYEAHHVLKYEYSAIQCKISSSDVVLNDIDPLLDDLSTVWVQLDGSTQTWDPNSGKQLATEYKDHLSWNWTLSNNDSIGIFDPAFSKAPVLYLDLSKIELEYSLSYEWEFNLEVCDKENEERECCVDTFLLQLSTVHPNCRQYKNRNKCIEHTSCVWEISFLTEGFVCEYATTAPTSEPTANPITRRNGKPTSNPTIGATDAPSMTSLAPTMAPTRANRTRELLVTQVSTIQGRGKVNLVGKVSRGVVYEPMFDVNNRRRLRGPVYEPMFDMGNNNDKKKKSSKNCKCMVYDWVEENNKISKDQMKKFKDRTQINGNSVNLVLDEDDLTKGESYSFRLTVQQLADEEDVRRRLQDGNDTVPFEIDGYGQSVGVDIFVPHTPTIHENSFTISPDCVAEYFSFSDLMNTTHSLSLFADDDFTPLSYQYGYIDDDGQYSYFQPDSLSESYLHHIYLPPIGNFSIFGQVKNSLDMTSSEQIECSITLTDYSQCLYHWKQDIIDAHMDEIEGDITYGADYRYSYIYFQSNTYLKYLSSEEYIGSSQCIGSSVTQVLETLNEHVLPNNDTCSTAKWTVFLSETVSVLLMDLINSNGLQILYDNANFTVYSEIIEDLLQIVLDPCWCIGGFDDLELLHVDSDSMITQIPAIYYANEDVTECLPPIILYSEYHYLLDAVSASVYNLVNAAAFGRDISHIFKLISNAIYIKELMKISTAIPGTKICTDVSACSVRIDDEYFLDNVSLQIAESNTFVHIPLFDVDFFNISEDEYIDFIAYDMDAHIQAFECGKIHFNVLSIGILHSNHNVTVNSNGSSVNNDTASTFIQFMSPCEYEKCDNSMQCVEYDQYDNFWYADSCNTSLDYTQNVIYCSCLHRGRINMFGTIRDDLSRSCTESLRWFAEDVWDVFFLIFCAIYMMMAVYAWLHCAFCNEWNAQNRFLYFLIGCMSFFYGVSIVFGLMANEEIVRIKFHTLWLAVPKTICFEIFCVIFYIWYCTMTSFEESKEKRMEKQQKLKLILFILNGILLLLLVLFCLIILPLNATNIYVVNNEFMIQFNIILCVLFTLIAGSFIVYSLMLKQGMFDRLLLINVAIFIYFIFLLIFDAVSLNADNQSTVSMAIYFLIHFFFLIFLVASYKEYMSHTDKNDVVKTMINMSKRDLFSTQTSDANPKFSDDKSEPLAGTATNDKNSEATITPVSAARTPESETKMTMVPSHSVDVVPTGPHHAATSTESVIDSIFTDLAEDDDKNGNDMEIIYEQNDQETQPDSQEQSQ